MARLNDNMITQVSVKNYRSLGDVNVELSPLNVLVGANASGKSNFVDALRFVGDALNIGLDGAFKRRGGIGEVREWNNDTTFDIHANLGAINRNYTFTLRAFLLNLNQIIYELYRSGDEVVFERDANQWSSQPQGFNLAAHPTRLSLPLLSGLPDIVPFYDFLTNMR